MTQQQYLSRALRGFYEYFGLSGCSAALEMIRLQVRYAWILVLRRRSQRGHRGKGWYFSQRWFWVPPAKLRPRRMMAG